MTGTPFTEIFYSDWQVIAIAAAVISVLASSFLIMASRLFSLKNLEQVAKTEFVYAASTVLIVVMAIAVISAIEPMLAKGDKSVIRCLYLSTFGCSCDANVNFPDQNTLIDWVSIYMEGPADCVKEFMSVMYVLSIPVEGFASVYMEIFMSEHASGFGVKWIAERIKNTTHSLTFYMYIYYVFKHMMLFIKYYSGFFFSIGVALRAFPPTRGAGAYIMALSLGLYFVFPLTYVLVASMSLPHMHASTLQAVDVNGQIVNPLDQGGAICRGLTDGGVDYNCMLPRNLPNVETYACEGASIARAFEMPARIATYADVLETLLEFRVNDFTRHLISAICLFPLISMVVLFTFVLNTTNLFGGNIPEIGRGLVKLI
jgi:hypothetical protein